MRKKLLCVLKRLKDLHKLPFAFEKIDIDPKKEKGLKYSTT